MRLARRGWCGAIVGVLAVTVTLTSCTGDDDSRYARPGTPRESPSGDYVAVVESGPGQSGVSTWRPTIRDADGDEVYRDADVYSTRQGVSVTWLSTADQLWILSSDVGYSSVDRSTDGTWTKVTPEGFDTMPAEIRELIGR